MTTTYQLPMFARLEQCTPWNGGMLAGSDVVTLDDAAKFASKHAGTAITPADFLRAAGRGQIPMLAICPRAVTMEPCRESDKPLSMPGNSIPTLPLDACKALSNTGRAEWRTIDGLEKVEAFGGVLGRFTRWQLPDTEPDILTTPDDCRVMGWDVHSLADAFIDKPPPRVESLTAPEQTAAPVVTASDGAAKRRRRTWRDVTEAYLECTFKELQCPTVKEFFAALTRKAGNGSPFDKGVGQNSGNLFARDVSVVVTFKMIEGFVTELRKKM